jgi:hypothetical protein
MYPAIGYHLAQAHLAGLRHQAQRDTLARAARRARTHQPGHPPTGYPAAVRRLLTALAARTSPRRRSPPRASMPARAPHAGVAGFGRRVPGGTPPGPGARLCQHPPRGPHPRPPVLNGRIPEGAQK